MIPRHDVTGAVLAVGLLLLPAGPLVQAHAASSRSSDASEVMQALSEKWVGDLDGMIRRRLIRALVVYSRTNYFIDAGEQRGASYDALRIFEDELNSQPATQKIIHNRNLRVHVVFIPVRRDELIPALLEGRGDVAAAGITITPEREKLVDFSDPILSPVKEIVVTGPATPQIATLGDLSGQEVFVRKSSSEYEHLQALNESFANVGKAPVKLKLSPESLEDEDLMEMLNAGLVRIVVVNDFLANFWIQVLPKITPRPDLAVNVGGEIAWMFRENSPQLKTAINEAIRRHPASDPVRAEIFRKYLKSTSFVKNATDEEELRKFQACVDLFKKYGDQYSIDYLLMMAQGYQESRLDQHIRSPVGAIGVMQLMPVTGKAMEVGDIRQLEANVHAGIKYITFMRNQYYANEPMDELNKTLFSFASYNAGPQRIAELRKLAAKRGLDPNLWFNNVAILAAEKIGRETVTYVANIFKYYIAYTLVKDAQEERAKAMHAVQ